MSDAGQDNGRDGDGAHESGILAALPRTRPQRASPRRASTGTARTDASSEVVAANGKPKAATRTAVKKQATATPSKASAKKRATATKDATATKTAARAKPPRARPARVRTTRGPSALTRAEPPVPKQGYEPEDEVELGTTVNPPSGVELVESVADIVGEIAGAGLTAGGRLLKDALSLLRLP